jgi:hypothetical protein
LDNELRDFFEVHPDYDVPNESTLDQWEQSQAARIQWDTQEDAINIRVRSWNEVDQAGAIIDSLGIAGDLAFLIPGPGTAAWLATEALELTTVTKAWDQLDAGGDPSGVIISTSIVIGQSFKLLPENGTFGNILSLWTNFVEVSP